MASASLPEGHSGGQRLLDLDRPKVWQRSRQADSSPGSRPHPHSRGPSTQEQQSVVGGQQSAGQGPLVEDTGGVSCAAAARDRIVSVKSPAACAMSGVSLGRALTLCN